MNERRVPLTDEEPKHKKKSTAKGLPRSKHKHQYETVLLSHFYYHPDIHTGKEKTMEIRIPTKVCMICGRVEHTDRDPSYYIEIPSSHPWLGSSKKLSERALNLPKWYVDDYFDKFAKEGISEASAYAKQTD